MKKNGVLYITFSLAILSATLIADPLPFFDNFNDGDFDGWEVYDIAPYEGGPSNWTVISGVLTQTSNIYTTENEYEVYTGTRIITGDSTWSNFSFNVELKSTDNDGVGLLFRYRNQGDYYRYIRVEDPGNGGPFRRLQRCDGGVFTTLAEDLDAFSYPPNFFCTTVWVSRDSLKIFEEGILVLSAQDDAYPEGRLGFMCYANGGSFFDNVMVLPELVIDSSASALRAGPYLQNPTINSITIMWETASETTAKLYWGTSLSYSDSMTVPSGTIQSVLLEGLLNHTRYYYALRLGGDIIAGPDYYFETMVDPETPYRMAIWGDNRTDYITHETVINAMITREPHLAINVGDVVTSGGVYEQWVNEYLWPARNLLKNTASFISIGNHENDADWYEYYVEQPGNEHWYSVRYGPAYLIFIDTNRLYFPLSEQYNWLVDELSGPEAQSAPWLMVFHHHPPYSEGWDSPGYNGEPNIRNYLVPLYEYYNVDFVFAGHTHDYERGSKEGVNYIITGGGGAALDSWQQEWEYIDIYHSIYHYILLDIDQDYIIYRCYDWENMLVDSTLFGIYIENAQADPKIPGQLEILSTYPNPFNSAIRINYSVPEPARVDISIYNMAGYQVAKIAQGMVSPGVHTAIWETCETKRRKQVPTGVYLVRLSGNGDTVEERITLVK
ncbi:metallophosphoesterase [bacterium]|nr:metallophosphoesterase [bacterium]